MPWNRVAERSLGLFIVNEIAKAHGGAMEVISTDEQTRFTFSMPLE